MTIVLTVALAQPALRVTALVGLSPWDWRGIGTAAAVVAGAWAAHAANGPAARRRERAEQETAAARQRAVARQVSELGELRAAWEEAHPGVPMPAGAPAVTDRTNTLAVLALVFGVGGGLAAIPLGHVAKAQIARTGERGAGLATAGLVLGYLWVAALVVLIGFTLAMRV